MSHRCPECYKTCHCGNDWDDKDTGVWDLCRHCTRKMLYIPLLMLLALTLACIAPQTIQSLGTAPSTLTPAVLEITRLEMVVIADTLNIRAGAGEGFPADYKGLKKGDTVTVYLACTGGELREWASKNRDCTQWVRTSWLSKTAEWYGEHGK